MSSKFTILLAVIAGFAGGVASRYASPSAVHAQAPAVQPEVRAQKFVLVDQSGAARGAFGVETDGSVQIEITDNKGRPYLYQTYIDKFFTMAPSREGHPKVLSLLR